MRLPWHKDIAEAEVASAKLERAETLTRELQEILKRLRQESELYRLRRKHDMERGKT